MRTSRQDSMAIARACVMGLGQSANAEDPDIAGRTWTRNPTRWTEIQP
mgnify:CR=1 FL=1